MYYKVFLKKNPQKACVAQRLKLPSPPLLRHARLGAQIYSPFQ
jgi:hypothetical protein